MTLALWHIDPASGSLTSVTAEGGALVLPLKRIAPTGPELSARAVLRRGETLHVPPYGDRPFVGPVEVWRDLTGRDYRTVDPTLGAPLLRARYAAGGGAWPADPAGGHTVAFVRAWFALPPRVSHYASARSVSVDIKVASGRGEARARVTPAFSGFGVRTLADAVTCDGCVVLFNPEANGDLSTPAKWIPALVAEDPVQLGDASDAAALARVAA